MSAVDDSSDSSHDVTPSRSSSKLETLSRDDLLKFVKKQMVLQQKMKARCDELTKELGSKASEGQDDQQHGDYNELLDAYNASQQSLQQSASSISTLNEQVDCMTQKVETLTTLYHTLQTDYSEAMSNVKSLTSECESLRMKSEQVAQETAAAGSTEMARKNAEQQLATTLEALESSNNRITELESLLSSRDEQVAELAQVHAKNSALEDELNLTRAKLAENVDCVEKLNEEFSRLKELEVNRSSSMDKMVCELRESLDGTKQQLSVAEDEKQSALSQLEHVQQLLNDSGEKCSALAEAHTALQSDFDSMKQEFDQLKRDHLCSNDHTAAVVEECAVLRNAVENLTVQHDSVLAEKEAMCQEIADLKKSLRDSMEQCENLRARENTQTAAVDEECAMLKHTVENLTVQLESVLAEKQAICQEIADLGKSLHDSMEQYDNLKARENILCRGVVNLNCAASDKTLVSHIDDASLSLYSDGDVQSLLSAILINVTGFQNKLELNDKQMQDECQLREKMETEMALLVQEGDAMRDSIHSLQEENNRLLSTCKQLESSQAELSVQCNAYSSQVAQLQVELEAVQTSTDNVAEVEKTAVCPDVTLLPKSVDDKDAEIERLQQEIRAYKLDIERLEQERELHAVNQQPSQASLSSTCEKRDEESQSCELDHVVETQRQVFGADTVEGGEETVVSENVQSVSTVELLNEAGDELLEMKEKMAEWETMMTMLQTERDEIQAELRKLERQEKRIFGTVDEVLQCILNSMKGRDLFPSNSDTVVGEDGCDSEFWNKLALLKTVVDELVFEVDEMKEKVHHMTDEVKISEKRVSELEAERNDLKEEAKEKSVELQRLRESEDALKMRECKLITEVEQMRSSMSDIAEDLKNRDALLEKTQVLGSDVDKLNVQIELLHTEVASKDQLLSEAKVSEETLQESLREAEEQLRNSELLLSSAESKYSVKIGELEAERDQLSTSIGDLQRDNDALHQHCDNVADDLQSKYNDKCSEATELHSTVTTYCKQVEDLKEQLKVEVSEKEELKTEHTKLAGTLKDLELHLDQLRAETDSLSAAKITLEQKFCSLQEESEQKMKLSESQISHLEVSLSTIQTDHTKMCERKSAMENELTDCTQKLELTSKRLSEAEEQCSHRTAELLQVRTELEQLKEECRMQADQKTSSCNVVESVQKSPSSGSVETTADSAIAQVDVESLQRQLKEREDRENKLKQLALKAKKEATELRNKLEATEKDLESAHSELRNKQTDADQSLQYQCLQTEYDQLERKYEMERCRATELESSLQKAAEELSHLRVSAVDWADEKETLSEKYEQLSQDVKVLENKIVEKEQELEAEVIQRDHVLQEKLELERQLQSTQQQMKDTEDEYEKAEKRLQEQLRETKDQLSSAQREAQQSNMMDLEIADYERTVKSLHDAVAERDGKVQTLHEEIQCKEQQQASLQKLLETAESQHAQAEEHSNKLKQMLVKTKKDLADAKKLEGEQKAADAQVRGKMEMLTQLTEEQKLKIADLVAENHRQMERLQAQSDTSSRASRSLELRVQSLEHDLELARLELSNTVSEYEGYKVRVHSVLKQQKHKSSVDQTSERDRLECQRLQKMVDQLRTQLQESRDQMQTAAEENQLLQEEHDRLQQRYCKLTADAEQNERIWRERVERLTAESTATSSQKVEAIQQLMSQNETLTLTFKEQLNLIQEEHRQTVDALRNKLDAAELEIDRLHVSRVAAAANNSASVVRLSPDLREMTPDRATDYPREHRVEERQSGEGSENIDDEVATVQSKLNGNGSQSSFVPFEQLLSSQLSEDTARHCQWLKGIKTIESEETTVRSSLAASEKQIEHLTVLLNESEATVLRLTEQASVLKGEIRRLERNQERENAISNMEYLKNIVYKFLTLKGGSERTQLVPVLTTMLKFSPEEKEQLVQMASGTEATGGNAGDILGGLGLYMNRWSGFV